LLSIGKKHIAVIARTGRSHGKSELVADGFVFSALTIGWPVLPLDLILAFLLISYAVVLVSILK
jgi:hypothetical protein